MTKPDKRTRRELRAFLFMPLLEALQSESRREARSVTQQLTVILSDRYGMAIEDQYEKEPGLYADA